MNAIIKMGKTLALISFSHSRKISSFVEDPTKVIMQVFTTIELYSRDITSCCQKAKGFGSGSRNTSFDR